MSELTKQALAQSLKNLMNKTSLSKITVNDIVQECQVNRRTFYYHFQDIYELLEWIFKNEVAYVMAENKTQNTWQEGFLRIFHYLENNKKMVVNTYYSIGREQLETHLYSAVYALVLNVVDEITSGSNVPENEKIFVVNFFKIALVGLLLEWIRNNMSENPDQIIESLTRLISDDTKKALLSRKTGV